MTFLPASRQDCGNWCVVMRGPERDRGRVPQRWSDIGVNRRRALRQVALEKRRTQARQRFRKPGGQQRTATATLHARGVGEFAFDVLCK